MGTTLARLGIVLLAGIAIAVASVIVALGQLLQAPHIAGVGARHIQALTLADGGHQVAYLEVETIAALQRLAPEGLAVSGRMPMSVQLEAPGGSVQELAAEVVLPGYFEALDIRLIAGSAPTSDSDARLVVSPRVAELQGVPAQHLLGRSLVVNGREYGIAGVAPAAFGGTGSDRADVWIPLHAFEVDGIPVGRYTRDFPAIFGTSLSMRSTEAGIAVMEARAREGNWLRSQQSLRVTPLGGDERHSDRAASLSGSLPALHLLAILVFLCVVVSSLVHAALQALEQRRHLAIRHLLGATYGRILVHLAQAQMRFSFGVAVTVVVAASVLWLVLRATLPALGAVAAPPTAIIAAAAPTACAMLLVLGLANLGVSGYMARQQQHAAMRASSPHAAGRIALAALTIGVTSLAAMFLFFAATLLRAYAEAKEADYGIASSGYTAVTTRHEKRGTGVAFASRERAARKRDLALAVLSADGRFDVAATTRFPGSGTGFSSPGFVTLPGADRDAELVVGPAFVTPALFRVAGINLLAGRDLDATDGETVAVINRTLARRLFGDEAGGIGRQITWRDRYAKEAVVLEVVGIVSDVHYDGIERSVPDVLYRPASVTSSLVWTYLTTMPVGDVPLDRLRDALAADDTPLAVSGLASAPEVRRLLTGDRAWRAMVGMATAVVLGLSAVAGVSLVASMTSRQRRRENAVRLSLGESPRGLVTASLTGTVWRIAAGIALGMVLWVPTVWIPLESLGIGISTRGAELGVAVQILFVAAAVLALVPTARRLLRLDPARLLRSE